MFYCKSCGDKNDWPQSIFQSLGPCEICGHSVICSDVPSSELPIPSKDRQQAVNNAINSVAPFWRHWCTSSACACMGCFNRSENRLMDKANTLLDSPITKAEFLAWAELNPKKQITYD